MLHRRGILRPKVGLFTPAGRAWLTEIDLDEAGRSILERHWAVLDDLRQTIKQSNGLLRILARQPRWAEPAKLIQTMPGVGLVTALTVLAELGDLRRFHSRSAVSNYAGLVPVLRESNEKRYQGGITKRGPSHLRSVNDEAVRRQSSPSPAACWRT